MLEVTNSVQVTPPSIEVVYNLFIRSNAFREVVKRQLDLLPRIAIDEFVIFYTDELVLLKLQPVILEISGKGIKIETRSAEVNGEEPWSIAIGYGMGNLE